MASRRLFHLALALGLLLCIASWAGTASAQDPEWDDDDEVFAADEFEVNDEPGASSPAGGSAAAAGEWDDEDDEVDENDEDDGGLGNNAAAGSGSGDAPTLKIVKGPGAGSGGGAAASLPLRWEDFQYELLALLGVVTFFLNYLRGRSANQSIAKAVGAAVGPVLDRNFAVVGDTKNKALLVQENCAFYYLWASGRVNVARFLGQLELASRHDLFAVGMDLLQPSADKLVLNIVLDPTAMDAFVFALVLKAKEKTLRTERHDVKAFLPSSSGGAHFGLPAKFQVLSECGELGAALLTPELVRVICEGDKVFESLVVSDRDSGGKDPLDLETSPAVAYQKTVHCTLRVPPGDAAALAAPLRAILDLVDRLRGVSLSAHAKRGVKERREKIAKQREKQANLARQEAARDKKVAVKKQEREKLEGMSAEQQRKWEEQERKKELRQRMKKMSKNATVR